MAGPKNEVAFSEIRITKMSSDTTHGLIILLFMALMFFVAAI